MLQPRFSPHAWCSAIFGGLPGLGVLSVSPAPLFSCRVTGGELFEDIVAREYYSEADAR